MSGNIKVSDHNVIIEVIFFTLKQRKTSYGDLLHQIGHLVKNISNNALSTAELILLKRIKQEIEDSSHCDRRIENKINLLKTILNS